MPRSETLPLWPGDPPLWNPADPRPRPFLRFLPCGLPGPRPVVAVFPGGGYNMLADHEGEPVARFFHAHGFHGAVVHYRVQYHPAFKPLGDGPLEDARRAIRLLRLRAREWNVDPARIAVLGFSAGGHLAATAAVRPDSARPADDDPANRFASGPNAAVLCYSVLSGSANMHADSFKNLCGDDPAAGAAAPYGCENLVTAATPPCFLWHTSDDPVVPVGNSLLFASALARHGVPFAMHIFPHGRHGLGMAEGQPGAEQWPLRAAEWLKRLWPE